MRKRPAEPTAADIGTLEMMLDYAILEGAELRLPLFVLLLRAARVELMNHVGAADRHPDQTASPMDALVSLDARPHGHPSLLQDR